MGRRSASKCSFRILPPTNDQLGQAHFFDQLRLDEARRAKPYWPHATVSDASPALALRSVWPGREVGRFQACELVQLRLIGKTLDLKRLFVFPANHEGDVRIAPDVCDLSRRVDGIEEDLEIVRYGDSNKGGLRNGAGANGRYDPVAVASDEVSQE